MAREREILKTLAGALALAFATAGCPKDEARPLPPDPMEAIPQRPVRSRLQLYRPSPANAFAARPVAYEGGVLIGGGARFLAVDPTGKRILWITAAAPGVHRPGTLGKTALLPFVDRAGNGRVTTAELGTGKVLREVTLVRTTSADPGAIDVAFNTTPAFAEGRILWPSSRRLTAFDLATGREAWTYESAGPTPYRRFQFGSDPPLVEGGVVYWGHQQGLAAVDLATGKARWAWAGYRGFATRPVLSPEHVLTTTDHELLALDRQSGVVRWFYGRDGLGFEHVAGEDVAGYRSGVLWTLAEPVPFHYWLLFFDAKTGKGRAAAELFGRGLTGSVATDGLHLYARLAEWLVCYRLATAKPLWRVWLGGAHGGSSPTFAHGRVFIVDADANLLSVAP